MKDTDEQVRKWFAEHADQLEPEELVSEEAKQMLFDGSWPAPREVRDLGVFSNIKDASSFDNVVSNPDNWATILSRSDLFESWILPHAALCFGKLWFDRVKWRNSISKGVPFPLFTEEERQKDIENTPQGRAKVAKIVEKISVVLRTYLEGKWYKGTIKKPSGYIIDSLKNEFIREIGIDMGYKSRVVPACPYCLSASPASKVPLVSYPHRNYSCPRCQAATDNLTLQVESMEQKGDKEQLEIALSSLKKREKFTKFMGITCICPSDECAGRFVPLSCVDRSRLRGLAYKGALKGFSVGKNVQSFRKPPEKLLDFPLTCPYCETKFTPRTALQKASGFKEKSGFFTGLPSIRIWMKKEDTILDTGKIIGPDRLSGESFKDQLAAKPYSDDHIVISQRLNLLIGEIIIQMSRAIKNTVSGLTTWYFLAAVIRWMTKYGADANNYFFNWKEDERDLTELEMEKYPGQTKRKVISNTRGQEMAVHQAIFHEWMDLLDDNIGEFTKISPRIRSIKDFSWFCRQPKFTGGPETIFYAKVNERRRIPNISPIRQKRSKVLPRLARVCAIRKDGEDFTEDVGVVEWRAIRLKPDSLLRPGDKVLVEALVMSGHPSHAPIQRILRLRSLLLKDMINRILEEEKTCKSDKRFWESWRRRVDRARKLTGITVSL